MLVRIIKSYRDIVAVCDSELLGKRFEENNFQIEVKESFFKGEDFPEDKVVEIMRKMSLEDSTFNIVGEKSVGAALKAGIISEGQIGEIQGIPFAIILL